MKTTVTTMLENYTGKKLIKIELFEDPHIDGVYAVKASWNKGKKIIVQEFLLNVFEGEDSIEEVEFTTWPPSSRT